MPNLNLEQSTAEAIFVNREDIAELYKRVDALLELIKDDHKMIVEITKVCDLLSKKIMKLEENTRWH